jgi:antitoxin (DNA-binding transcriptional repressor) of toxin-antitoxin stability system
LGGSDQASREVRSGRTIVVTDHGEPVARVIPEAISLQERVEALRKVGTIAWSGRRLPDATTATECHIHAARRGAAVRWLRWPSARGGAGPQQE